MLKEKYDDVLKLGETMDVKDGYVEEESGKLKIGGKVRHGLDRDRLWDKIKTHSGWENEIEADIEVRETDIYGEYEVQKGDTLWKISQQLLGKGNLYMKIFEVNQDRLTDPDKIKVGQMLRLPNR